MTNEISIANPGNCRFWLAHMFLLVKFKGGRFAKSTASPKIITSFIAPEGQYPNFPDTGLIVAAHHGEPMPIFTLRFDQFYEKDKTY